jgi:RNA polymerase sigma factor (TIGR02999 family)
MSEPSSSDATIALNELSNGKAARAEQLMPLVYDQLRALASNLLRQEKSGNTLQATALVNEAYLKLVDQTRVAWKGKSHFFAIGATAMRRILVDHARSKHRSKRGGGWKRVELRDTPELQLHNYEDILAVDEALQKLESIDPVQAKIVELRFFGGLTVAEVAEVLQMSKRKVEYEWEMIRAWLRRELGDEGLA